MHFHYLTLLTLFHVLAHSSPSPHAHAHAAYHVSPDLEDLHAFPREAAFGPQELHRLQKRTTIPDLVPTTTVKLVSTGTAKFTTPALYGTTTVNLQANGTPVTSTTQMTAGGTPTDTAASMTASGSGSSTSSSGSSTGNVMSTPLASANGTMSTTGTATTTQPRLHHTGQPAGASSSAAPSSSPGAGFQGSSSSSSSGIGSTHGPVPLIGVLLLMLVGL